MAFSAPTDNVLCNISFTPQRSVGRDFSSFWRNVGPSPFVSCRLALFGLAALGTVPLLRRYGRASGGMSKIQGCWRFNI